MIMITSTVRKYIESDFLSNFSGQTWRVNLVGEGLSLFLKITDKRNITKKKAGCAKNTYLEKYLSSITIDEHIPLIIEGMKNLRKSGHNVASSLFFLSFV